MANDFSEDTDCKALWSFESGALTTDSIGTNTLTDISDLDPVAADTGDYKEKAASAVFVVDESANWSGLGIDDGDLDAGFPLKSGDTSKKISLCFWYKHDHIAATQMDIYNKYLSSARCIQIYTVSDGDEIRMNIGQGTGSTSETKILTYNLTDGRWDHLGVVIDGVAKTWLARHYNSATETSTTESGTMATEVPVNTRPVRIGYGFNGRLDEMVVFDDLLTEGEIDQVMAGSYGGTPAIVPADALHNHAADQAEAGLDDSIFPSSCDQNHSSDQSTIQQTHLIDPAECAMGHQAEASAAYELFIIAPAETSHAHAVDATAVYAIAKPPVMEWAHDDIPPASTWVLQTNTPSQEIYIAVLRADGYDDLEVPMSSMQLRRRDGSPTMVSIVVPDAMTYVDAADDRVGGEIVIYAGRMTLDGTRHLSEFERAELESVSYDVGVRNSSLSLSGYRTVTTENPRPVDLEGITYHGLQADGKRRIRGKVNFFLRPGDTAIYGDDSFLVDQIYVKVEARNSWMEAAGT